MIHLFTAALLACLVLCGPPNAHGQGLALFGLPMEQNTTDIFQPASVDLQAAWNVADQGLVDLATGAGQALGGLTAGLFNLVSGFISGVAQAFGSVSNMLATATIQDPLFQLIGNITATAVPLRAGTTGRTAQAAAPATLPIGATVERLTAAEVASLNLPRSGRNRKVVSGQLLAPAPAPGPVPSSGRPGLIRMRTAQTAQGAPAFIGNLRGPLDLGGR